MKGTKEPIPALALDASEFPILDPDSLESPRLLVFRSKVEANIARMRALLEALSPGSGFRHLRSHAKTCKSSWAVRLQMAAGIAKFKATPNELHVLIEAGARDIFVAYPPLPHLARAIAEALARDRKATAGKPPLRILSQVGAPEHAEALARASKFYGVEIEFLIDLDVGMGRTGIHPEKALWLLEEVQRASKSEDGRLRFSGLHAYDGQNRSAERAERTRLAGQAMGMVLDCAVDLERRGIPVPLLIAGGTPSFLPDLEFLLSARTAAEVEGSPGTWIFWDSTSEKIAPGMFLPAALLFARVMDRPGKDRIVLDIGHKRWALDSGPLERFSREGLEVVATSEEHTVLSTEGEARSLRIGDFLLAVPRHVCPTVNLWETFALLGPRGEIEDPACPVDGRNR